MYPYLPKNRKILYVKPDNKFMKEATELLAISGCVQPTAAVIVKNRKIISRGTNKIKIKVDICPRKRLGYSSGTGYEICKSVCGQEGHAEAMAIRDTPKKAENLKGASLYLDGHWWICKDCWDKIIKAGISRVYLRKDSMKLYKK